MHKATLVLICGIFSLILVMGIARFSFTPMIAYMQDQTTMGDALAGWLAGWNYFGYFIGVLLIPFLKNTSLKYDLFRLSLILAIFSTALMGMSSDPLIWGISRFLAGLSTAGGLLLGSGLILDWLLQNGKKGELGVSFAGIGLGIALSALLVELTAPYLDWREQWFGLALFGVLLTVLIWRGVPCPKPHSDVPKDGFDAHTAPSIRWLTLLGVAYTCSGFAFVIYATFVVVIFEQHAELHGMGVWLWALVGLVAAPSPFFWDYVTRRTGYIRALQMAFVIMGLSLLFLILGGSFRAYVLSAILYGATTIGIVSMVLTMVGIRYRDNSSRIMAILTLGYCFAQITGPIAAGELAEWRGTFNDSLLGSVGLLGVGLICLEYMKQSQEVSTRQMGGER